MLGIFYRGIHFRKPFLISLLFHVRIRVVPYDKDPPVDLPILFYCFCNIHTFPHVEALSAETREENFAKANSPMRSHKVCGASIARLAIANLASEKSAHQSDFSLYPPGELEVGIVKTLYVRRV